MITCEVLDRYEVMAYIGLVLSYTGYMFFFVILVLGSIRFDSMFSCVLLSSFSWSLAPNLYSNLGLLFDPSLLGSFTKFLGTFLFLVIVYAVYFCPVLNNAELMLLLDYIFSCYFCTV